MIPAPIPLLDGDTFLCDNSTLELHQTCSRASEYGICHRRRSTHDRIAQRFGGVAHKALEYRYKKDLPGLEQTTGVESTMIAIAEQEFNGTIDETAEPKESGEPIYIKGKEPIIPPPDDYRNFDRMVDLIVHYGEKYRFEHFNLVRWPDSSPFVEVPFALPLGQLTINAEMWVQDIKRLPNGDIVQASPIYKKYISVLKIVWQGKIDLVYEYNGSIFVMDHKTASIATNMAEFEISNQFYGYTWAVERLLRLQVAGFVINRMVCRRPTRTGEAFTLERKPIPVQRELITEWERDTMHMIAAFVETARIGVFPKHTAWCVGKFGTCQFHKVCCNGQTDQREFLLFETGEFEENTWSPLKSD